jgi:hypothetical protein
MIDLHPGQSEVFEKLFLENAVSYAVVNCSRGWGKSYMAATAAVAAIGELLELPDGVPNKNVYIIAPTHDQVTDIYFPILAYDFGLEDYCISLSRDMGRFVFPSGVELRLLSYESVERMRGKGAYFVVFDEVSSCTKGLKPQEAWQSVIQPCIVTRWSPKRAKMVGAKRSGRALIISTPKGYNYFHTLFTYAESDPDWTSFSYDYTTSPFLDPEEIEKLRHLLDPVQFATEYLASFKESGASVFYCFDRQKHVVPIAPLEAHEDVHVCIDFNVGLQCTSVFTIRGKQIHIFDEFKGHPDTETLAITLATKYAGHKIYAYPDPSGRSRKTSAPVGRTDFSILESHGIRCRARTAAPSIVDSVAAVNRMLMTAAGDINFFVDPRCVGTITSLERTTWVDNRPDTAAIDKSTGVEHFSDGVRYGTEFLFPVTAGTKRSNRGFGF